MKNDGGSIYLLSSLQLLKGYSSTYNSGNLIDTLKHLSTRQIPK